MTEEALGDMEPDEQALFIAYQYPGVGAPERLVLLVIALYEPTLERLAFLTCMSLQTARKHARFWVEHHAVRLAGSGKSDKVSFLGAQAWLTAVRSANA